MANLISEKKRIDCVDYFLDFPHKDGVGGFTFECDSIGRVDLSDAVELAKENYADVTKQFKELGRLPNLRTRKYVYNQPAVLRCDCGRQVRLVESDNDCDCGRIWNLFGQELAPRAVWGSEWRDRPSEDEGLY